MHTKKSEWHISSISDTIKLQEKFEKECKLSDENKVQQIKNQSQQMILFILENENLDEKEKQIHIQSIKNHEYQKILEFQRKSSNKIANSFRHRTNFINS